MHKKSSEFSWGRSPSLFKQLFTHTHTLTGISLVEIESAYAWQLTQKHSSLPLAGRLLALLGVYKTLHTPSWSGTGDGWTGLCEWEMVGLWERREVVERWGILYSLSRGRAEAPRQQQLPPFWWHKQKGLPSAAPASGPPSPPQGKVHHSPERSPQSSPPLSSSSCPVLFVQPGRITWSRGRTWGPNHTGLNAFTCDPHS